MTPLPQRSVPSVAADGRSASTSTRMPTTAGSTRRIWEASGETWRGAGRGARSDGAAIVSARRSSASRAAAVSPIHARDTALPRRVLGLVVLAEDAGLDRLPPRLVPAVPLHGRGERGVEGRRRRPAERLDLPGIERVAAVVTGPIRDRLDQALRLAEQREDLTGQRDVLDLGAAPDVVDLPVAALAQHEVDPRTVVEDVEPVPHVPAVAVEGQRLAFQRIGHEERDDLLGVLVRPEVVAAPREYGLAGVGGPGGARG